MREASQVKPGLMEGVLDRRCLFHGSRIAAKLEGDEGVIDTPVPSHQSSAFVVLVIESEHSKDPKTRRCADLDRNLGELTALDEFHGDYYGAGQIKTNLPYT